MAKRSVYLVLPYITTSKPVAIRGVTFRNSSDIQGISQEDESGLNILFKAFYLRDDLRIREFAYSALEYDDAIDSSVARIHKQCSESCLLIEYLYSHPHASWRAMRPRTENALMYMFCHHPVATSYHAGSEFAEYTGLATGLDESATLPGLLGVLLRRHDARFTIVEGSRLYPPDHHIDLNIGLRDLSHAVEEIMSDKTKWALANLLGNQEGELTEAERRCLYAMRWFADSCRSNVFEDQALLLQAVAFETLLNIDPGNKEKVTERFRTTIKTIVGGFPRIDSWIEQFYNARSRVVHEGGLPDSVYYAIDRSKLPIKGKQKESPLAHHTLTEYGRTIFHLCLDTLLSGSKMAEEVGLQESLIHNQERLESICKMLGQESQNGTTQVAIAARLALELRRNWSGFNEFVHMPTLLEALKGAIKLYDKAYPGTTRPLPPLIDTLTHSIFSGDKSPSESEIFTRIVAVDQALRELPWYDYGFGVSGDDATCLTLALLSYGAVMAPADARRPLRETPADSSDEM
jgi:hypothetical protein